MFLVLEEDNCVHVYESPDAAAVAIEALDVDTIRAAFLQEAAGVIPEGKSDLVKEFVRGLIRD